LTDIQDDSEKIALEDLTVTLTVHKITKTYKMEAFSERFFE